MVSNVHGYFFEGREKVGLFAVYEVISDQIGG
jgi:hypothetical protein